MQALFDLDPCALIAPHVHPRGTETVFTVSGEVTVGFHEENGGRVLVNNVTVGTAAVVPQGLIHWVQNNGCEPARYTASFPNKDAGTSTLMPQVAELPDTVLRGTLSSVPADVLASLLKALRAPPIAPSADPECVARCGGGSGAGGKAKKRSDKMM